MNRCLYLFAAATALALAYPAHAQSDSAGQWVQLSEHCKAFLPVQGWTVTQAQTKGQCKNGLLEGKTSFEYHVKEFAPAGELNATFAAGKATGAGELNVPNGNVYHGGFVDGLRDGPATYTYPSGRVLTGTWIKNISRGQGKIVYAGGKMTYQGEVNNLEPTGPGVLGYGNGIVARGTFKDGELEGEGVEDGASTVPNGGYHFEGHYTKGVKDRGTLHLIAKNITYSGELKNGDVTGHGVVTFGDGSKVEGEFNHDLLVGFGTATRPDGTSFKVMQRASGGNYEQVK